jgi:hypothetical protein
MHKRAAGCRGGGIERFKPQHSLSSPSPKPPLSAKKRKWAKIEQEARKIKRAQKLRDVAQNVAEVKKAVSRRPNLIKKGDPNWVPPKR